MGAKGGGITQVLYRIRRRNEEGRGVDGILRWKERRAAFLRVVVGGELEKGTAVKDVRERRSKREEGRERRGGKGGGCFTQTTANEEERSVSSTEEIGRRNPP